jgi:hypothetical protein
MKPVLLAVDDDPLVLIFDGDFNNSYIKYMNE